jgi:hypothetical protein
MFTLPPAEEGAECGRLRTLDDLTVGHLMEQLERPVILADYVSEVWERMVGAE